MPGIAVFRDASKLASSEILYVDTLEYFLVRFDNDFKVSLCVEDFNESSSLFLYWYWKSLLYFLVKRDHLHTILRKLSHIVGRFVVASASASWNVRNMMPRQHLAKYWANARYVVLYSLVFTVQFVVLSLPVRELCCHVLSELF